MRPAVMRCVAVTAAAPMRSVGGNVRGKVRAPGIDMGNAKVPATAPMAAATSTSAASMAAATSTSAATARSPASAALARERQIARANRKPERADTCGKSQDDKPADKLFADPAHDVIPSPKRHFLWRTTGAPPTPLWRACSVTSATVMLRCTAEAADPGRNKLPATIWPRQSSRLFSHFARSYGGNQIKQRTKCYGAHHDPVRGAAVRHRRKSTLRCRPGSEAGLSPGHCTVARMPQGKAKSSFPHEP
jgi:hypothetical protein